MLRLSSVRDPVRCAMCHADLDAPLVECPACKTVLHEDCLETLGRCPTLACPTRSALASPGVPTPRVELPRLGVLGQAALAVVPVVPLAVFAPWFGYYGVAGSLDHMVVPLYWLALPGLAIGAVASTVVATYAYRRRLGGLRRVLLVLGSMWLAALVYWNARDLGCWAWEQRVLAPRIDALRRSLDAGAPALEGLNVVNVVRGRQGFLLYRQRADALFPGFGIFISYDVSQTPKREGSIVFTDSSVRGVSYFHEYP